MAAEVLCKNKLSSNIEIDVFDAMPSVGRKFLMAGKGGLNITHSEPEEIFLSRYGARRKDISPLLDAFGPHALRGWIHDLGIDTFIGSSGRVFPTDMKAAPLLRVWLHRLREAGVELSEKASTKKDLRNAEEAFAAWRKETGLSFTQLSRICAMSTGENMDAAVLAARGTSDE